jgi:hypothetical protein
MLGKLLAKGHAQVSLLVHRLKFGNSGRGVLGRSAQQVVQDPTPSLDRGGPGGVGGNGKDGGMSQQPPSSNARSSVQGDLVEILPKFTLQAVETGEGLV